ncbi:hypothetical protein, partial [Prevotella bivia]|uniref:hypothetical protein n=1 Tax=Prevotella bivia TaxID=28125 RepID=UPI00065FAAFF
GLLFYCTSFWNLQLCANISLKNQSFCNLEVATILLKEISLLFIYIFTATMPLQQLPTFKYLISHSALHTHPYIYQLLGIAPTTHTP